MATPFLSSEEYDERAHRLYDDGEYDSALETLKEGLRLYPHSVELYVGLGYTRLAREEYAWARQAFERGLVLDPEHEDGLVGLGESLLRLGERRDALRLFRRVLKGGSEDSDLLLTMGRALYREQLYKDAVEAFNRGIQLQGDSAELAAGLGYTLHRNGDEAGALRELRRALRLDATHHEARIYLGHLLYDRGDWASALREFEVVPVSEHYDALAVARMIELHRALDGQSAESPELAQYEERLEELEADDDPIEALLADLEERAANGEKLLDAEDEDPPPHRVVLMPGTVLFGSWYEIVRQIRDAAGGYSGESVPAFMRRRSEEERARSGRDLPTGSAHDFVAAGARAGLWRIEQ
jgi:cytochrome c-type biogenesis protein CcmH/NrfG